MKLNDSWYNFLKWTALIFLPALGILIATVLPAWNIGTEYVKPIVITLNAIGVFIGALIGISQATIAQETAAEEFFETESEDEPEPGEDTGLDDEPETEES